MKPSAATFRDYPLEVIIVKQDENKPVPVEVLAESIKAIAEGFRKVKAGPLNERAVVLLVQHACPNVGTGYRSKRPVTAKEVRAVLAGLESLEREYLKPKPTPAKKAVKS